MLAKMTVSIGESVLEKIVFGCPQVPPETGGFLGVKNNVIVDFVFDAGQGQNNFGSYSPDTGLLKHTCNVWKSRGILLAGIAHSHISGRENLSNGDRKYISKILESNIGIIDMLLFPIIIPGVELIMYSARLFSDGLIISKEDLITKKED